MTEQLLDLLTILLIIYIIICLLIVAAITVIGAWLTIPKYLRERRENERQSED